jgi:hypothetical protein
MSHAEILLQAYGVGAVALIGVAFYAFRRMAVFALAGGVVVCAFAAMSGRVASADRGADWIVTTVGLAGAAIGLTFVRAMLQRSVSLHLLEAVERGGSGSFNEEITDRLTDMRRLRLIRSAAGVNAPTAVGRLIAIVAAASYFLLEMEP